MGTFRNKVGSRRVAHWDHAHGVPGCARAPAGSAVRGDGPCRGIPAPGFAPGQGLYQDRRTGFVPRPTPPQATLEVYDTRQNFLFRNVPISPILTLSHWAGAFWPVVCPVLRGSGGGLRGVVTAMTRDHAPRAKVHADTGRTGQVGRQERTGPGSCWSGPSGCPGGAPADSAQGG